MRVRVIPRLVGIIAAIVLACSLGFTSCAGENRKEIPSSLKALQEVLQSRHDELPEIIVNTKLQEVGFASVSLERTLTQIQGHRYYAFRFTTPDAVGQLVWAFLAEGLGLKAWYIVPASGQMKGFTSYVTHHLPKDVENLGSEGDAFILQRLPGPNLKPNTDYIMWFSLEAEHKAEVLLSLNVFPETLDIPHRVVFPMIYPAIDEPTDSLEEE